MGGTDRSAIRFHEDAALFREAVNFTTAETGFAARLVEKDYFCTVLLADLARATGGHVVFKGGSCLAKVIAGFYRLSEDLDFAIPMPLDATRAQRRERAVVIKNALAGLPARLSAFGLRQAMRGANNSTQYVGLIEYTSPLSGQAETIKVDASLREPLLAPRQERRARTLLLDPINGQALVPDVTVPCISQAEAFAEKFRAALTRRDVAIRDFYDLDYAIRKLLVSPQDAELVELVRRKLAVPGCEPVNVGPERAAELRRQVEARLRPVLRQDDYDQFDLDRAFGAVARIASALG